MEHFSVPAVVFCLKKRNRFPQRNELPSAKTKLFCRKAVPAGAEKREKQGFGRPFPLWMKSVRVQTSFVLLQAIPLAELTRDGFRPHGVPWRMARCRGKRLSAFILHSLGRARFAYFRSVPVPRPFARFSQGLS